MIVVARTKLFKADCRTGSVIWFQWISELDRWVRGDNQSCRFNPEPIPLDPTVKVTHR